MKFHFFNKVLKLYYTSNSHRYINYLKKKGVQIGNNVIIRYPSTTRIDITRPSLISIGNNVDINMNFQILTHDWCSHVFRNYFHDLINSSGKVSIGNNIYFGTNVIILKGVSIGDNCIIGANSVVVKNIPANSVATGSPCRVVSSLQEYYEKRKQKSLSEAIEYVKSIQERFSRKPIISEMYEEFIFFVDKNNIHEYPEIPIKKQIGDGYSDWLQNHKALFSSFDDFIHYALNIPNNETKD